MSPFNKDLPVVMGSRIRGRLLEVWNDAIAVGGAEDSDMLGTPFENQLSLIIVGILTYPGETPA
jgi:hypothetical protein